MPFDDVWNPQLRVDVIERFLGDAGEEGLTWEAKSDGKDPLHPGTVTKAICGMANTVRGGYIIVGAERADGFWTLPGIQKRGRSDLDPWLSQIAQNTVNPRVRFEIVTWPRPKRRQAAIVRVWPIAEPPAITSGGIVYERVSGDTVAITDPRHLADLFARGGAARIGAERRASDVAEMAKSSGVGRDSGRDLIFAMGLAPIGLPSDIPAVLFREKLADELAELLVSLGIPPPSVSFEPQQAPPLRRFGAVQRETLQVGMVASFEEDAGWIVCGWDGSVGLGHALRDHDNPIRIVGSQPEILGRFWKAGTQALLSLGCFGPTHFVLKVQGAPTISRWMDDVGDDPAHFFPGIGRELRRSAGEAAWEP